MKTRKIVSLLLAVLMVLSALPMAFLSVAADEPAAAASTQSESTPVKATLTAGMAPTTLPNGSYYTGTPVFTSRNLGLNYNLNNGTWMGNKYSSSALDALNNASGVMFKVDASAVAAGNDTLGLAFEFNVKTEKSNGTFYLASNIGQALIHSGAVKPEGATSTWYYSIDGKTWESVSSDVRYFATGVAHRGEIYFYIPITSMYTRYGETYLTGSSNVATEPSVRGDQVKAISGAYTSITNFCYRSNNTVINGASLLDFQFVQETNIAPTAPTQVPLPVVGQTMALPFISKPADWFRPSWFDLASSTPRAMTTTKSNFINSDGVMFELDTTNVATADAPQLSVMIAANTPLGGNGNNNYFLATAGQARSFGNSAVPADAVSTWYWSEDGVNWTAYTAGQPENLMTLPAKHTKAYVYIPFSSFWSRYDADYISGVTTAADKTKPSLQFNDWLAAMDGDNFTFKYLHLYWGSGAASADTNGKISNFCFVQLDRTMDEANTQPNTLPDTGNAYVSYPLFAPDYTEFTYADNTIWKGNIFANGALEALPNAKGIMFKMDATNVPAGTSVADLRFQISATGNNGVSTYICSNLSAARWHGNTTGTMPAGSDSVWYVSNDGQNWGAVTALNNRNMRISPERNVVYVYVPFSSMYVRHGEAYLMGDTEDKSQVTVTYGDATPLVGGWKSLNNFNLYFEESTINKNMTVSDFALVGNMTSYIHSASITVTDDIAYNVYVNAVANATDAKMTFTMNEKSVTVEGEVQADGMTKYTFEGILPQYIGNEITMTWTATVAGENVTETKTGSVLAYTKALLSLKAYESWHDLIKSLLYYGAAAQAYKGVTEGFVNDGVAANIFTAELGKLPTVYTNGDKDVFKTVALRLDNAIALKVGVVAPAGVTEVAYTVGERNGTAEIVNGYVYVPVYAYEMMEAIELTCGEATLTISASWYLANVNTTGNDALAALIQTIATYAQEATLKKGNREVVAPGTATLAQIKLIDDGGMSYVIQLEDGSFIVIDGGVASETDTQYANTKRLMQYLMEKSNYSTPVIAAWMFTHQHSDHTNNAFYLLKNYSAKLDVQSFAYTWAVEADLTILDTDSEYVKGYKEQDTATITAKTKEFKEILTKYPNATAWDMKTGESKMIGTVKVDVLLSAADKVPSNPMELNDLSAAWKMTFTQGTDDTADDKTFMVLGDCSTERTAYLATTYDTLKSDVLQASHHGLVGGEINTYKEIAPKITLVPTYEARYELWFTGASKTDYNQWLYANSTCYHASQTTVVNMKNLTVSIWN